MANLPYEKQFADLKKEVDALTNSMTKLDAAFNETVKTGAKIQSQKPTTLKETNEATKKLNTNTNKLTNLEKERIKTQNKIKQVFTQSLALQEKQTKTLIKGQERLKLARKQAREEAQKGLGVTKKTGGLFRSMTKSILESAGALLGFQAALNDPPV